MANKTLTLQHWTTAEEMLPQLPLLQQLSPHLTPELYSDYIAEMIEKGYAMVGVIDNGNCVAVSGYWIGVKLYCGRYLEVDNFIVDKDCRGKGVGSLLLQHLNEIAIQHSCATIMLDAYTENIAAHEFYTKEGFAARGFHFLKKLP